MLSPILKNFHNAVFVVTAPGFEERQEHVIRELGEGNFEFVYGVNKTSTSKRELIKEGIYDEVRAIELDRRNKPMTLGHICCSLGHARVYKRIIDNSIRRALIFEDDVAILPTAGHVLEQITKNIPDDAELIYWGWRGDSSRPWYAGLKKWFYRRQHDLGLLKYNHTMVNNLYPREYNEHFLKTGKAFYTHSYTITLSAAQKILEWNTPIVLNSDNALMYAVLNGDVISYLSKTQLFSQRSLEDTDPMESLTQD